MFILREARPPWTLTLGGLSKLKSSGQNLKPFLTSINFLFFKVVGCIVGGVAMESGSIFILISEMEGFCLNFWCVRHLP